MLQTNDRALLLLLLSMGETVDTVPVRTDRLAELRMRLAALLGLGTGKAVAEPESMQAVRLDAARQPNDAAQPSLALQPPPPPPLQPDAPELSLDLMLDGEPADGLAGAGEMGTEAADDRHPALPSSWVPVTGQARRGEGRGGRGDLAAWIAAARSSIAEQRRQQLLWLALIVLAPLATALGIDAVARLASAG